MDRTRKSRMFQETNNQIFHPAGATNFPYERAVLLRADKIRFALIHSPSLPFVAQHIFGLRYRRSIRTISRCSRGHHEAAASDVETRDMIRRHTERVPLLPTVHRSPKRRAISELAQLHLPGEPIRSSATHKRLRVTYQENPTILD